MNAVVLHEGLKELFMNPLRMLLSLAVLIAAAPEQQNPPTIDDVIKQYEKGLLRIEGVCEVIPDLVSGVPTVVVRTETQNAHDTVSLQTGGKLGGFPIKIVVSKTPLAALGSGKPEPPPAAPCLKCPIHCGGHMTLVDPVPAKNEPSPASETQSSWDRCDIARKWLGLARRNAPSGGACETMVSWSDDPAKIKWAIAQRIPHWRSQEMGGLRGSDRNGVDCPDHVKHSPGEVVCYTWLRHNPQCPLVAIIAPKDLLSPINLANAGPAKPK